MGFLNKRWKKGLPPSEMKPPNVGGLDEYEMKIFNDLFCVWRDKFHRNVMQRRYYDGKNRLEDLGISIPPHLLHIETVVGWPTKAVDSLAVRSRFDGFTFPESSNEAFTLLLEENNFKQKCNQAVTSELISSCAFMTVSKGGTNDPDVIASVYSAENAAAIWDSRKGRIKYGITLVEVDDDGLPRQFNMYTSSAVYEIVFYEREWYATKKPHRQGRPLMEALVHKPTIDRPFGKSRITRAVKSITDSAVRNSLRMEVTAEFATAPQKYLLGVDQDAFSSMPKWEAYIGSIFAVDRDENGDMPEYGQLSQGSMQPHTEYMRSLATRFAGETNIPVSELGIVMDNPSSAEAIYASKESLVIEANDLNETNGRALKNIGLLLLAIQQNKTIAELTNEEKLMTVSFQDPATPSIVSQADAVVKILSAMPDYAYSEVVLGRLGFTKDEIVKLQSEKRKGDALLAVDALSGLSQKVGAENAAITNKV